MSTGELLAELATLVSSAYERADLETLVRSKLRAELYDYAPRNETDPNTYSILMVRLNQAGLLTDFVRAVKVDRPQRRDVQEYCDNFLAHIPLAPDSALLLRQANGVTVTHLVPGA